MVADSSDMEDHYADHPAMRDHWWWRPRWGVGTRFYAWHHTPATDSPLHSVADQYAATLRTVPTLDVVPRQWRHITLHGVGHEGDVDDDQLRRVVESVRSRLSRLPAFTSLYDRAVVFAEAVALRPDNPEAYVALRRAIRAGISDAGVEVTEPETGFRAHLTLAYSNSTGDGVTVRDHLDTVTAPAAASSYVVDQVSLIRMHRDHRMYEWETVTTVPIGSGPHQAVPHHRDRTSRR